MLDLVKKYLRVDFDDEDILIEVMIEASKNYIIDAIGRFEENNPKHKLALLSLCSEMYERRDYTLDKNTRQRLLLSSLTLQEQLKQKGE